MKLKDGYKKQLKTTMNGGRWWTGTILFEEELVEKCGIPGWGTLFKKWGEVLLVGKDFCGK